MLTARPLGICLNCGYRIVRGKKTVAVAKFSWWAAGGTLRWNRQRYQIRFSGFPIKNTAKLMHQKECVAIAKSPILPPKIFIEYASIKYCFSQVDQTIKVGEEVVGRVMPASEFCDRSIHFDLPEAMPPIAQVFLIWLVLQRFSSA